jgi:hypothetical protein
MCRLIKSADCCGRFERSRIARRMMRMLYIRSACLQFYLSLIPWNGFFCRVA